MSFTQSTEELREFLNFIEEDVENVKRVIEAVEERDIEAEFTVHPKAESAEESVREGLKLEQVVKTLVFEGEELFAVLCPGDEKVDLEKLESIRGEKVEMADPGKVRDVTGYPVGAVSPFDLGIDVYMEEKLLEHDFVRPAAGSRVVGLKVDPVELRESIEGRREDIT